MASRCKSKADIEKLKVKINDFLSDLQKVQNAFFTAVRNSHLLHKRLSGSDIFLLVLSILGITTSSITTISLMTHSIRTLSIMTLNIMTLSIMILNIMTLGIMTISTMSNKL